MCPMCLGATCGERSIRLLGENETFSRSSPLLLCSSLLPPILDAFLVLTPCCHGRPNIPQRTPTHNTHAACFMPRHSKVGFKVLYSIISNLSRNSGCLIPWLISLMENDVTFSFRLSFFLLENGMKQKVETPFAILQTYVSPYHADPIPSVYV